MQNRPKDFYTRYQRHIELNGFGEYGQDALLSARIAIVGVGGLGSPVALYLAAAGIGEIHLFDDDSVSTTNLQRQILFEAADVGKHKVVLAADALRRLNPEIKIIEHLMRISPETIETAFEPVDIIIDGSDNFSTRYLLNHYTQKNGKTLISGAVSFFDAQISVFKSGGPCYECLYPVEPNPMQAPSCSESAVLGPMVGVIGSMMAVEAIKEIANLGQSLAGRVLLYSSLTSSWQTIEFSANPECRTCQK